MGKTKIKTIDDSAQAEEKKPSKKKAEEQKLEVRGEKLESEVRSEKAETEESHISPRVPTSHVPPPTSDAPKKVQKPGKAKPRSKKYQEVTKDLDRSKTYPIPEAVDMVKKLSYAKFNATIEAHISTAQTGIRGLVSLPYASGKKIRILAFPSTSLRVNSKGAEQELEGVVFGDDSTIEAISQGKVDFDLVIATPEWMPKLTKVAKILGPKGLMPNPKNGTIADDLKKAVESFQAGKTEYKTEPKAPVIHLGLGKLNQPTEELSQNVKTLLSTLGKSKIKKVTLSPTMGPSVKVDLTSA